MSRIDIDAWAGDSLGHQRDTAAGPLAAALRYDALTIGANARATVPAGAYEPLVMIAPAVDLGDEEWVVEITRIAPAPQTALEPVRFAAFSEIDGFLPYMAPAVGADHTLADALVLRLRVRRDGALVPAAETRNLLRVRYAEGRFAKLLAITQGETLRTRRLGREIAARRTLEHARGFMLDRIGRELAVPRLEDEVTVKSGEIVVSAARESDDDYRNRLGIYRPYLVPTRSAVLDRLNGAGSPLQAAGAPSDFDIREDDNPFMVSFKVFGVGGTANEGRQIRARYLKYLRDTTLIDPVRNVPTMRHLPSLQRQREQAMRLRLRGRLQFDATTTRSMAPWLARAFDRAVRCLDHLAVAGALRIVRCQEDAGGSRFELGLAAELHPLPAGMVSAIRTAIEAGPAMPAGDRELEGVLAELADTNRSDPAGTWFFRACGFRTVAPLSGGRLLLSHISMGNLQLEGPDGLDLVAARSGTEFSAKMQPEGNNIDMALANALAGGATGWPAGVDDWTVVPPSGTNAALAGLDDPGLPQQAVFDEMGLGLPGDIAAFRQSLNSYPAHVFRVLQLGAGLSGILSANDNMAVDRMGLLADTLGANGAASMVVLKTTGGLVLIVGSIGLPQIGTSIGPRRSSDFFWSGTVVSGGSHVTLRGQGTRTIVKAIGAGVFAATTLAYSRIGGTDPFEWRVTLPPDAVLDYAQYEILMNLLDRTYPVGVEINTWTIRRRNVALDGVHPQPLSPRMSRSYRPFLRRRFQGSGDAPALSKSR